jgi:FkbM family methyltransferase
VNQLGVLRHILDHPLNRGRSAAAVQNYLTWQVRSRLASGAIAVPFVNDSVLMVRRGMHGATQNIYCGLADFHDMGFLLHLLRPGDLFADVGANVGSYTVLATAVAGARTVAFEPNPETFPALIANLKANGIVEQAEAKQAGAGATTGVLRFESKGTGTRVMAGAGTGESRLFESPVVRLDESLSAATPTLIKIDVEGFESEVLAGADGILGRPELLALIVENNEDCVRFGFAPDRAHKILLAHGFVAAEYSPEERRLTLPNGRASLAQNSIYVRGLEEIGQRLTSAPAFRVKGRTI